MIFANALGGFADEAHPAIRKILDPAEIVADFQRFRMCIQRVDRKIAARGIFFPFGRESHSGSPPVRRNVAP